MAERPTTRSRLGTLVHGAVIGAVASLPASWVKQISEPQLQRGYERMLPPTAGQKDLVGADPAGSPENMPPAVLADRVAVSLFGTGLTTQQKVWALHTIHYGFGAVLGAGYGAVLAAVPRAGIGLGGPAGIAMYGSTHASTLPLLGVQQPVWRLPPAAVGWEATSHLIFGLTLEIGRRALTRVARGASRQPQLARHCSQEPQEPPAE